MGSDSDLPLMREAAAVLEDLGIPYEAVLASVIGHCRSGTTGNRSCRQRHPGNYRRCRRCCPSTGCDSSLYQSSLVIGVPVKGDALSGMDSLYSIVQMPAGVPVAAMAVNGAKNAGIFAAQILALEQEEIRLKLEQFKQNLADKVKTRNDRLQEIGVEKYLQGYQKND